ncbi:MULTISPECIES: hypothetical protein [unclassified Archaeoglobus]|jgi:PBP1b-binding outer membrane lipoprotein LpoB|uniref:hypothetical protein n=1 Tax=unclassified Archaeoglobus TaxID=2643606 RepID=UPI0025C70288|nr:MULTISPECIES: hypothetical protein [unclassified Archaeoglobus]
MKALLFLLLAALLLSGCVYVNDLKNKTVKVGVGIKDKVQGFKESVQQYWACMEGCYFMQQIHEQRYHINITKEDHDACAAMCWSQYGGS